MARKRGNPTGNRVLSQHVSDPVAEAAPISNVDGGNPAKLRVPAGKKTVISQSVGFPAAPTVDYNGSSKPRVRK